MMEECFSFLQKDLVENVPPPRPPRPPDAAAFTSPPRIPPRIPERSVSRRRTVEFDVQTPPLNWLGVKGQRSRGPLRCGVLIRDPVKPPWPVDDLTAPCVSRRLPEKTLHERYTSGPMRALPQRPAPRPPGAAPPVPRRLRWPTVVRLTWLFEEGGVRL